MSDAPTIFLSAAEASGDDHAARLIRSLRRRLPEARFVGAAGPRMVEAGCESLMDLTGHASMVAGPLANLRFWRRAVRRLREEIRSRRPAVFIPVDSPALNWHLCEAAKQAGAKVVHFIAPQVWAWADWRIKKVRRLSDHVCCLLPFEEAYFRDRGVEATFIGHPLFDDLPPEPAPEACPDLLEAWTTGAWRVALLPGSRPGEIRGHAAALAAIAGAIRRRWPEARCTFTARDELARQRIEANLHNGKPGGTFPDAYDIRAGETASVLAESHFAVAASGTVTLEVAGFGVPMVILHRLRGIERIVYPFARRFLLHTRFLSLPNILAGEEVVPELMPWYGDVEALTETVLSTVDNVGYLVEVRQRLLDLVRPLRPDDGKSAADRAAILVERLVKD